MIPPIVRRCPECGHLNWSRRFRSEATDGSASRAECPACHHRFGRPGDAWRN